MARALENDRSNGLRRVVEKKDWYKVGNAGVPDRREHRVELGPLWVRHQISGLEGEGPARAFLTYHDLRLATASGWWVKARQRLHDEEVRNSRRAPYTFRPAGDVIPHHDPVPAEILTGLSLEEATALVQCAGGRLPTQKELDYILQQDNLGLGAAMPAEVCLWTASTYGLFDYSHCRYSPNPEPGWHADDRIRLPKMLDAAGNPLQAVIEWRQGRLLRHCAPPDAFSEIRVERRVLRATALVVMTAAQAPAAGGVA